MKNNIYSCEKKYLTRVTTIDSLDFVQVCNELIWG